MRLEPSLRVITAPVLTWVGLLLSLSLVTWEEEILRQAFPAWDPSEVLSPRRPSPSKLLDEPPWAFDGPYDLKPCF